MRTLQVILINVFILNAKCVLNEAEEKSKNVLPSFRKQIEEIEDSTVKTTGKDDARSNLVAFLVENVKEIFNDLHESTEILQTDEATESSEFLFRRTLKSTSEASISIRSTGTNDLMTYENISLANLLDDEHDDEHDEEFISTGELYGITGRNDVLHLTKDIMYEKPYKKNRDIITEVSSKSNSQNTTGFNDLGDPRRSCIACDNVMTENCANPKNKLIPSVICERDDDLCYSQHTPFGIIDRGCFNINHNLTTYVCSCNLCNYISISEMPYIFSNKRNWVDNVVELSRTKHFRLSVFKDMSCLRCEVNVTTKRGDMLDGANCLEGNIGTLPIQECEENEVCAVKAVRSEGYIWRGCVKSPLYNYWWALCDSDLCNYDTLISIFDFLGM